MEPVPAEDVKQNVKLRQGGFVAAYNVGVKSKALLYILALNPSTDCLFFVMVWE